MTELINVIFSYCIMYSEAEIQWDFDMDKSEVDDFPLMDMFGIYSDPLYASLDVLPTQNTLMQGITIYLIFFNSFR